jgi:hypothetical protein
VGGLVNQGMRSCVDTLGRSAPAAMGVATCYGQEGQILRLNAKGTVHWYNANLLLKLLLVFEKAANFLLLGLRSFTYSSNFSQVSVKGAQA